MQHTIDKDMLIDCTVDILLATWNGGKYLAELLDSILAQTYTNWQLIVSDDGSTDNTLSILNDYQLIDSRVRVVNRTRQGGVVENFRELQRNSSSPYVMFCDQDDIWNSDKVSIMVEAIRLKEQQLCDGTPVLGFSDMTLVDQNGVDLQDSFYRANGINPLSNLSLKYLVWRPTVYGCTVIFNKSLLARAAPMPMNVAMHDSWFALVAARFGAVFFVDSCTIKYRQHSENVVGGKPKSLRVRLRDIGGTVKKISLWTKKARWLVEDCSFGNDKLYPASIGEMCIIERLRFVFDCVLPLWRERTAYTLLFSLYFVVGKRLNVDKSICNKD